MKTEKPRLRWKKQPAETGLRRVRAGPRGFEYHDGETKYATVSALGGGWRGDVKGWYWSCPSTDKIPHENTCNQPCATPEEAKKAAAEYVQLHLKGN